MEVCRLNAVKTTYVYTHMEKRFIFQDQYVFLHFALKECFVWEDRTKSTCTFTEEQTNHKAAVLKMAQEFNVNSFVLKQPQLLFCTRSLVQYSEKNDINSHLYEKETIYMQKLFAQELISIKQPYSEADKSAGVSHKELNYTPSILPGNFLTSFTVKTNS